MSCARDAVRVLFLSRGVALLRALAHIRLHQFCVTRAQHMCLQASTVPSDCINTTAILNSTLIRVRNAYRGVRNMRETW
jgi:hypothetical protein